MRLPLIAALLILAAAVAATPAHNDTRPDPAIESRLKRARDTYVNNVESARKRLREDYDSAVTAYTRAGNLDQALAVRKLRDQVISSTTQPAFIEVERPDVVDGWTILFRSPNPLIWDLAVRNQTMTAAPVSLAPKNVKFLRMTRMDTGEAVIVPCDNGQLLARPWPISRPAFRGDQCLGRGGRALGIVDPHPQDAASTPIIDVTPHGNFSGWGFAIWEGDRTGQGYVWNSKNIPPTTFEIAVTDHDLSPDEQKLLANP